MSLVQPPAQCMARSEVRPACSGLYAVISFMNGDGTTSLDNLLHCLTALMGGKGLPHILPEPLLFQLMSAASHPPTIHCCETPGSIWLLP